VTNDLHEGGDGHRLLYFSKTIDRGRFWHRVVTLKRPNARMARHAGDLAPLFVDAGVDIVSFDEGYPNAKVRSKAVRLMNSAGVLARSTRKLIRRIREDRVDVLDAHGGAACLVSTLASAVAGTQLAVTDYGTTLPPMMFWPVLGRFVFSRANAVISDSEAKGEEMSKWILRRRRYVHIIPNGITPPTSTRSRREMLEYFGLPNEPGGRIVGQISGLNPHKGHAVLLRAIPKVLSSEPKTAFLIVGYAKQENSEYKRQLEQMAIDLRISDRVRICSYPGWIGDVWKVIDVQAHPALSDSLPNAIIEGMSLAKPAVVTNVGGIPTMVEHEITGLVVPPHDENALATALLRVIQDQDLAKQFADAAFARFSARYTAQTTTRQLEDLFAELALKPDARSA
jgi:glycosyltransferase involved in cell wall biosynthesis